MRTGMTGCAACLAGLLLAAQPARAQVLPYEDPSEPDAPWNLVPYIEADTDAGAADPQAGAPAASAAPAAPAAPAAEEQSSGAQLQYALLDRLEWAPDGDTYSWDYSMLFGGDADRVYFGTSGDGSFAGALDYLELNAFYSRNVGGDWDLNAGLRYDALPHPDRLYGVLGTQYDDGKLWFGGWAYLSAQGELSGRIAAYYNLKLMKRLYLQPAFELDAYAQDVPILGIGRGLSYAEAGLRMRYEIVKHLAPYVGFSWSRDLGRTADMTRAAGEDPESSNVVLGVRSEF